MALGKQRIMPQGLYSQHVICKQQDQLIARLRHVDLDHLLVDVLKNLTSQMLDGGPSSGLGMYFGLIIHYAQYTSFVLLFSGMSVHPESVPMHTLARFLFASLLNQYVDLSFQVGLRAMRLPVLEDTNENAIDNGIENSNNYQRDGFVLSRYPR